MSTGSSASGYVAVNGALSYQGADVEYECSICPEHKKGKATHYCGKCGQNYCDECISLHKKLHKDHRVQNESQQHLWGPEITDTDQTSYGSYISTPTDKVHSTRRKEVQRHQNHASRTQRRRRHGSYDTEDNTSSASNLFKMGTMESKEKTCQWLNENCDVKPPSDKRTINRVIHCKHYKEVNIYKDSQYPKQKNIPPVRERRRDDVFVQEQEQASLRDVNTPSDVSSLGQSSEMGNDDKISEVTNACTSIKTPTPLPKKGNEHLIINPEVNPCHITGVCVLPEGSLILVDQENFRVKQFDQHLNYVSYYLFYEHPWDVCAVEHSEMAITVYQPRVRQEIYVMSVSGRRIREKKVIRAKHNHCRGIAYHDKKLYVGHVRIVSIYSMASGEVLNDIFVDTAPRGFTVRGLALSLDGEMLYVTDFQSSSLITFEKSKRYVTYNNLSTRLIVSPSGVCVSRSGGRVFVCDSFTHAILEVDRQGKRVKGTVGSAVDPRAIWFDERNNRLLVGQKNNNVLIIYL
ncbi:uncharacterized protein LOC128209395 [Mya arenaria]|uniref:uncharacterized protein LOC128209395 n=1 Tax=Mya arenaria TaxID=6604 RepID=UPI0022E7760C|nr:uncharacterized protein LOC128209395 [Mya arenaria]